MLRVAIGVAKVNKYASRESGDTVEVVERPGGGLSAVLVDGQGSGSGAKALSMMVTANVVRLLKEGVRDGAAARAANDILFVARAGKVSAALDILSVDLRQKVLILTRNAVTPALVISPDGVQMLPPGRGPLGTSATTRPEIHRLPLRAGTTLVLASDGIAGAGRKFAGSDFDLAAHCGELCLEWINPEPCADAILQRALTADRGRPADDMTVIVLSIVAIESSDEPRRMLVTVPLP